MDIFLNFDFSVLDFIAENIRCAFLDPVMWAFSMFANKGIGWILLGLVFLIPKETRAAGAVSLAAMLLGMLVGEIAIKNIVCRIRPYDMYEAFHKAAMPFTLNAGVEDTFCFPSGHTCCSFAVAVSYFKINKKVGITALVAAALVGFSRLYNYVHYPTDVLCGTLLGILSAILIMLVYNKLNLDNKLKIEK